MKKLFLLTVVALLAGIIFSSCDSSYSLTKRRYNKGYYVHHNSGKTSGSVAKTTQPVKVTEPEKIYVLPTVAKQQNNPAVQAPAKVTAEAPKKASVTHKPVKHLLPAELSVKNQVKAIKKLAQRASADTSDDALSLLWLVVVVILILYIIGLLMEIGGPAIHILAVIALVLLILWLLKIL
jgi:hypothetical protein